MTGGTARRSLTYVVAAVVAGIVASLGAAVTQLGPWYFNLKKPSWQPPDWLFGPAWTLIFGLCAMAGGLAWNLSRDRGDRARVVALFAANAVFNFGWSLLFFGLHRPDWALVEVAFLWVSVLALIAGLRPISRVASWLLLPYLAWVSFAAFLNWTILRLNGPFG